MASVPVNLLRSRIFFLRLSSLATWELAAKRQSPTSASASPLRILAMVLSPLKTLFAVECPGKAKVPSLNPYAIQDRHSVPHQVADSLLLTFRQANLKL